MKSTLVILSLCLVVVPALGQEPASPVASTPAREAAAPLAIDPEAAPVDEPQVHVFRLAHGTASQAARVVKAVLEGEIHGTLNLVADESTNSLLVMTRGMGVERVASVLRAFDQAVFAEPRVGDSATRRSAPPVACDVGGDPAVADAWVCERIPFAFGSAEEAVDLVFHLTASKRSPACRLGADSRTNAMLVSGAPGDIALVRSVVTVLDVEVPSAAPQAASFERIAAAHASVDDLALLVRGFLAPLGLTGVQIATDPRTNAILVAGRPEFVAAVRDLIARLDVEADESD